MAGRELLPLRPRPLRDASLEIGPGSGKGGAAARAARVPDHVRGAWCRTHGRGHEGPRGISRVSVVNAGFEKWVERSQPESFGLTYAATAWHWIDPYMRYRLTADLCSQAGTSRSGARCTWCPRAATVLRRDPARVRRDRRGVPEGTEFSTPETLPDSRAEIEASGLFYDRVWIPGASVKSLRLGL